MGAYLQGKFLAVGLLVRMVNAYVHSILLTPLLIGTELFSFLTAARNSGCSPTVFPSEGRVKIIFVNMTRQIVSSGRFSF